MSFFKSNTICKYFSSLKTIFYFEQGEKGECIVPGTIHSEYLYQVPTSNLLQHTLDRMFLDQDLRDAVDASKIMGDGVFNGCMRVMGGQDGSGGFPAFNQRVEPVDDQEEENESRENESRENEETVIATQLTWVHILDERTGNHTYVNPLVNSAAGNRIMQLRFQKESKQAVRAEHKRVCDEVANLPIFKPKGTENVFIRVVYYHYRHDRKCQCYIQDVASAACSCCGATPNEMSTPGTVFTFLPGGKQFGFTSLHTLQREFKFCFNLAAHQPFRYHMTRKDSENRATRDHMMRLFHDRIVETIGVKVNCMTSRGPSNTGNVCRRCFRNAQAFADALEIPYPFIHQIWIVYMLITSRYPLVYEKFEAECKKLSDMFFQYFKTPEEQMSFYKNVPSFHSVCDHPELLLDYPCPPGFMTEEGSEANNKDMEECYFNFTRKTGRKATMKDFGDRMQVRSDPKVSLRLFKKYRKMATVRPLPPEVIACLQDPKVYKEDLKKQLDADRIDDLEEELDADWRPDTLDVEDEFHQSFSQPHDHSFDNQPDLREIGVQAGTEQISDDNSRPGSQTFGTQVGDEDFTANSRPGSQTVGTQFDDADFQLEQQQIIQETHQQAIQPQDNPAPYFLDDDFFNNSSEDVNFFGPQNDGDHA